MRRRTKDICADLAEERLERLRSLAADLRNEDRTDVEVVVGQPHVEVVNHVLEHDHDLVVIGGGNAEASEPQELPSGVTQLLRTCPVPVWVMRTRRSGTPRILALVDPAADDPTRDRLNGCVLDLAASLARNERGELHVGHALEQVSGSAPEPTSEMHRQGEHHVARTEPADGRHDSPFGEMFRRHLVAESEAEVHLVSGHAGEVLPTLADQLCADLIVVGTVARSGISGLIIGNSVETMLRSVSCSVLAVKPNSHVAAVSPATQLVA
jgi:nucleotide-binding universal stress UspA family protein